MNAVRHSVSLCAFILRWRSPRRHGQHSRGDDGGTINIMRPEPARRRQSIAVRTSLAAIAKRRSRKAIGVKQDTRRGSSSPV